MKVFLSHSSLDKELVRPIATWLHSKGIEVWLDEWSMTAGDSLVGKIGEGIASSDRLVVFLTPNSIGSNWVTKEVATGIIMELAEDKGLGEKFVVPAVLQPCKVPIMLRDKLYANFTNKAFEAACEELLRGIENKPTGAQSATLQNGFARYTLVPAETAGKHAIIIEFGVKISPTEGLHIGIDLGAKYSAVKTWFAIPNSQVIGNGSGMYTMHSERQAPPIYERKFQSPSVTSTTSFYCYFEADTPFTIGHIRFLDYLGREV